MINDMNEYEQACEELRYLETWLNRLQKEYPGSGKGLTKAGIRKMIARLHDELGTFEASLKIENASSK